MQENKVDSKFLDTFKNLGIAKAVEVPVRGFLSTGSLSLDWAVSGKLRGGGFPLGRIIELYGDPSTGKSLITCHLIAEAQKLGWYTFLDDSENVLDPFFAKCVGVDLESLRLMNSETIEGHYKRVSLIIRKIRERDADTPILIALDSLAAVSTTHERGSVEQLDFKEDETPELKFSAKDMTKAQVVRSGLRILSTRFMKENVLYVISNHTTAMIGNSWGPKTTTPGGGGVKFHSSVRVSLTKGKIFDSSEGPVGLEARAQITKNKVSPPFKKATFDIYFNKGIVKESGFIDILQRMGVITEAGGWWRIANDKTDTKYRKVELEGKIPELVQKAEEVKKEEAKKEEAEREEAKKKEMVTTNAEEKK